MVFDAASPDTIAAFVAGAACGVLATLALVALGRRRAVDAAVALEAAEGRLESLREEVEALAGARRESEQELRRMAADHGRTAALAESRAEALAEAREREGRDRTRVEELGRRVNELEAERAELRGRLEARADREQWLEHAEQRLEEHFTRLGRWLLAQGGREMGAQQREQLDGLLGPLKDQLGEFRRRLDEVQDTEGRDRASLLAEIRHLQTASEGINREARQLTEALRSDKRLQGNWGELVLTRVLEASGLREGHEFDLQVVTRSDEGDIKRPDVVVRLPDRRDVVVDAKVSLVAWERACACEDPDERERLLARHAADLRAQVERLARQRYAELPGLASPDFVLLFVPIEGALAAALQTDPELLTLGFGRRVLVVGPTTLLLALRIVEQTWRRDRQHRHAEEIARRAAALYERLERCSDDLDKMGRQVVALQRAWEQASRRLAGGRGSALAQARAFVELGEGAPDAEVDEVAEGGTPGAGRAGEDHEGEAVSRRDRPG